MEMPLQSSHYNPSRETLGRYSEYSLHSSYKIRAGDAACKWIFITFKFYRVNMLNTFLVLRYDDYNYYFYYYIKY